MSQKVVVNKLLIKQAVLAMQSNARVATAHTKTRGEVSGGGRKPWRQKGTGRARAGSSRSPIWSGGGITFGPRKERNWRQALPKKMAVAAKLQLWQLLKDENRVSHVPSLKLAEPKTKLALKLLLPLGLKGKTLLVTKEVQPELILAVANLPRVEVKPLSQVSLLDLASAQTVVMELASYETIYGSTERPRTATKKSTAAGAKK